MNFPLRRSRIGLVVLVLHVGGYLALPAAAQNAGHPAVLPPELLNEFDERGTLERNARPLSKALQLIEDLPLNQITESVAAHAAERRRVLSIATETATETFSVYRDLLRFPESNRGQAVQLSGVVRSSERIEVEPLKGVHLIRITPADAPSGTVAVLLSARAKPPRVDERVRVLGVFAELIEVPGQDGATVPLVVARDITPEDTESGVLPDKSLWSVVQDRTFGVRSAEAGPYYRLLRKAESVDESKLREAARRQIAIRRQMEPKLRKREPFPVFVDMFGNPKEYRGQAVSLTGYAREVRKYPAGANAEGIDTLYETWIYTDDSQSNPAVVVSTNVSEDMPIGDDLQVPVRASGYFFKIYGYRARDTTRIAPMILAGSVERLPEPNLAGPPWWLFFLLAAVFLALLAWLVVSYRGERRRSRIVTDETKPDFTNLSE